MIDTIQRFSFVIQGVAPGLMTHNPLGSMNGHAVPVARGAMKPVYDPVEEAERGTYRNEEGHLCVRSISIRNSIMACASFQKIGRVPLKQAMSHIQIEPSELVVLLDPATGQPLSGYEVDVHRVVIQRKAIMRGRPLYPGWMVKFDVLGDIELVPQIEDILRSLLVDAGQRMGIGEYRPGAGGGGPYGRFVLVQ